MMSMSVRLSELSRQAIGRIVTSGVAAFLQVSPPITNDRLVIGSMIGISVYIIFLALQILPPITNVSLFADPEQLDTV